MILLDKGLRTIWVLLIICVMPGTVNASPLPAVDNILRNGFPVQHLALAKAADDLYNEYQNKKNITSLLFNSFGLLQQAKYYSSVNDLVRAAEYAKTGFFRLDEAVDLNENDMRVRYLRARIDAYLPAELGRCVIAMSDTEILLNEKEKFVDSIQNHINEMRYLSLIACKRDDEAKILLANMKSENAVGISNSIQQNTPVWDVEEVANIILLLINGD